MTEGMNVLAPKGKTCPKELSLDRSRAGSQQLVLPTTPRRRVACQGHGAGNAG
jgi:hypothetical protein